MTPEMCGCCELPSTTPLAAVNRPGLSAIAFRAGTYGTFRFSMLQRIARTQGLSTLRSRSDDDYAITLLDMWATVADILTFYQERIANEGFLRTARLRDSILRMARLLDYQLRPGVAASALLAFTLDTDASLKIPVGLRVQSVPAEDEQPQIYETIESILADSRLNRVRVFPAPEGFNPLAKGQTSATLAPGPAGLAAAAALAPGDRVILFNETTGQIEELAVRTLRVEDDRVELTWAGPIQGASWDETSPAYAFGRTFRVFGYNTPTQYMEAVEGSPGSFTWQRRTFGSANYAYAPVANVLELDAKHEGITVGSRLLVSQAGASNRLVTVTAVGQAQARFVAPSATTTPYEDTVTRVTVDAAPSIGDRRTTVIYEIKSPRIRLWGYRYPKVVNGGTVYIPAKRIDADTAAIGRAIQNNAYTAGGALPLTAVGGGRKALLIDASGDPTAAAITSAAVVGLDVDARITSDDFSTALALRLDPEQAQAIVGVRSAVLPSSLSVTTATPELKVAIGSLPPRIVTLSARPVSVADAAARLQAGLIASLPAVPEFGGSLVLQADDTLIVLPGIAGLPMTFEPTPDDPTTAGELGLTSPDTIRVDGLLSGDLSSFPVISSPRELSVTFGPIGPRTIALGAGAANLAATRTLLQSALRAADPAPAFRRALVMTVGPRLLILPGTGGAAIQEYLALGVQADAPFVLDTTSAVLFGNVARATHGETVHDEVVGDGNAAEAFQAFELQQKPLTYTSSAEPGGAATSLRVFVNDVLWSEVPTLFARRPTDQVYTTRIADDGTVTVRFGDGRAGARPPSGRGNIAADYRHGSGLQGRVAAGSLRAPLDMPVGLKSVTNPAAATGGADPESIDRARENAPSTVRTFGRAVSLRDFEDLVRSSGEVAKALATWVWNGEARAVHLTVAGQEGQLFEPADLARLHARLTAQRDPNHALFLANFVQVPIVVTATVRIEGTRVALAVAAAARAALLDALSFRTLRFGQPLALSEIYGVLQHVPGVDSVDIDLFQFKDRTAAFLADRGATAEPVQRSLRIRAARPHLSPPPAVLAAELAVVEAPAADIQIITSGGLPD